MTHGTIEETYEYRIKNVVKAVLGKHNLSNIKNGEKLELYLREHIAELGLELIYDIEVWMGFDDLLKQVKE